MSIRYQAGIIRPGYDALKVADAPTIGVGLPCDSQVFVAFTAPTNVGGGAISSYTAYTSCGVYVGSNSSSPVTVTGLTNGSTYTFKVIATNAYGPSYPSAASANVIPALPTGNTSFTSSGTFSWVAPTGVYAVSVVAVGGGGAGGTNYLSQTPISGGGGGGLGYYNNYTVTPGSSYTVVVGAGGSGSANPVTAGGQSYFVNACTVRGSGGGRGPTGGGGGSYAGTGGGSGGTGGTGSGSSYSGGGGGAGGYAGNGGTGGSNGAGLSGSGGAGGGGGSRCGGCFGSAGGGGVGLNGQGCSGSGGAGGASAAGGGAGSGGSAGGNANGSGHGANGGAYGGGGGGNTRSNGFGGSGSGGAVRIIWPGSTRSFPSTSTGEI